MNKAIKFGELVELVDRLSLEEKEALMAVVRQRTIQERRCQLAKDVRNARKEYHRGRCKPATPDEIMREILR